MNGSMTLDLAGNNCREDCYRHRSDADLVDEIGKVSRGLGDGFPNGSDQKIGSVDLHMVAVCSEPAT